MSRTALALFVVALAVCARPAFATELETEIRMPDDLDQVEIFLHTVDVGWEIYESYGHAQLRVVDHADGSDYTCTWGVFDYDAAGALWRFYHAEVMYRMGAVPTHWVLNNYQRDSRTVWEDRLELTNAQKRRLIEDLQRQQRPDQNQFRYRYFHENCATKVRDVIDTGLGGAVRKRLDAGDTGATYRDMVRNHHATTLMVSLVLDATTNARMDHRMSQWEGMFVPKTLRRRMLESPRFDDDGNPIEGTCLLSPVRTWEDAPTPAADWRRDDAMMYATFGAVPLLAALMAPFRRRRGGPLCPKPLARACGATLALWGLGAFVLSTLMVTNWIWSGNPDFHHCASLWLLWPVDVVFVVLGCVLMLRGEAPVGSRRLVTSARFLAIGHIVAGALCAGLWWAGLIEQDMGRTLATVGVCGLLQYLPVSFPASFSPASQ